MARRVDGVGAESRREERLLKLLEKLRREFAPLVIRAEIVRALEKEDSARLKAFYAELDRRWARSLNE